MTPRTAGEGLSPVVELRQYTLHPGQREILIDLFDGEFVEPQERTGMRVIGQFRDVDDADKFVWLRGFSDMTERARSLAEFYDGPVWERHRDAANATMIDSDDVLLLRPARHDSAFALADGMQRDNRNPGGIIEATIVYVDAAADEASLFARLDYAVAPTVRRNGGSLLACFVSETSENTFPRLPVREGEPVFVVFAGYPDPVAFDHRTRDPDNSWQKLLVRSARPPQILRLAPTSRSFLDGHTPPCEAFAGKRHPRRW